MIESDRLNVEKVKRKKNMFDGLFVCQLVSTSVFFLNAEVFYRNYFSI